MKSRSILIAAYHEIMNRRNRRIAFNSTIENLQSDRLIHGI
jgi:hypothetical protein